MNAPAKLTYAAPDDPLPKQVFIRSVERLTGCRHLERIYEAVLDKEADHRQLWAAALRELRVQAHYDAGQLAKAPTIGPVVLIANHPYGVLDRRIKLYMVYVY